EVDDVGAALRRHAHVVVDAGGTELELDRDPVVGRLADLLDLQGEVVGAEPVGVTRGRALIDPRRQRAHLRDLLGHLLPHQVAAEPDLAALADEELARDRKSTRLNSSHRTISYAVFCLKKKIYRKTLHR